MPLDAQYVALFPIQEQIWDKTLNIPAAGAEVYFYSDVDDVTPKPVYQLVGSGAGGYTYVELPNPLILSGIGTYVDPSGASIIPYLWPYEGLPTDSPPSTIVQLYYIKVLDQNGGELFDIHAWPPSLQGGNSPLINEADTTGNIIQNGQFVQIDFPTSATQAAPFVISTTGTNIATEIAPDWSLITNGTGTVSIYRKAITDTTAPSTGNPAYALGIAASTGYSLPIILRQRILAPRIFSNSLVSGTFIAESLTGTIYTLTMSYVPSGTETAQIICSGNTPDTLFGVIANATAVTITPNAAGAAPSSYVDITITIPVAAQVLISNIQLCGVSASDEAVSYLQNTPEQEINGLFHYYNPKLMFKPIPSLLTGWDFPLNPAQLGTSQTMTTTPAYIWDQTVGASAVANMNVVRGSNPNGVLSVTSTGNTDAFYLLQYLSGPEAIETALSRLSVNISAWDTAAAVTAQVYLFNGNTSSALPGLVGGTIGTLNLVSGSYVFTLTASNWAAIPQNKGNSSSGLLPGQNGDIGFSGWDPTSFYGLTGNFAIVVVFNVPTSGTSTVINSISCVPGDIPTRPAPQTADEVLRECQYYYEKSYDNATAVPTSTLVSSYYFQQTSIAGVPQYVYPEAFSFSFNTTKRVAPAVVLYPSTGTLTAANVRAELWGNNSGGSGSGSTALLAFANAPISTFFTGNNIGTKIANYFTATAAPMISFSGSSNANISGLITFQFTADARLGVVA